MARLIDADALMVWLVNMLNEFDDGNDPHEIKREMFQVVLAKTRKMPTVDRWISVNDRMPVETHSIFWPWYGRKEWSNAMWREQSDKVLVTVTFKDGTRLVSTGETHDGEWHTSISKTLNPIVTHWMQLPEPPKEEDDNEVD